MKINIVAHKYGIEKSEMVAFYEFIKRSNYKYKDSIWTGCDIDDNQDIAAIVQEFKSGNKKNTFSDFNDNPVASLENMPSKLIECPDCGKQISRKANVCIHCGCPLSDDVKNAPKIFYGVRCFKDIGLVGKAATFINRAWVINGQTTGVKDLDIIALGITKERAELLLNYLVSHNGKGEIFEHANCTQENKELTLYIDTNINPNSPVMCPRCGSTQVVIGQRGYSIVSGLLGSQKTTNRCGKCGYSWQPSNK